MQTSSHHFLAHEDAGEVSAIWMRPSPASAAVALAHGAGAGMQHANMQSIAEAFGRVGIATFRFQFPFMERGGGRDSLAVSLSTVRAAVQQAAKLGTGLPLFAGGHSFGGRMTSLAAAEAPLAKVQGLIFCSYPLHQPGEPADARAQHLPDMTVPVLFLSGTRDKMMTLDLLQPALKKLGPRATFRWLDTGDHGYKVLKRSRKLDIDIFDEMAQITAEWIKQVT